MSNFLSKHQFNFSSNRIVYVFSVQRAQKSNKQIAQKINQYSQERRATRKFRDVISAIIGVSTIQTTESELQTPDSREGAPAVSAIELQNKLASISEEENKKSVDAWGEWNLKSTGDKIDIFFF